MKTKQLELVTFEQAKRLKELGFDWEVRTGYYLTKRIPPVYNQVYPIDKLDVGDFVGNNIYGITITAPTVALALKWLRDEKGLFGCVDFAIANFRKGYYYNYFSFSDKNITAKTEELFGKYEEAESALLDELLNVLESKKEQ